MGTGKKSIIPKVMRGGGGGSRTRILPLSEEEFREQRKARSSWSVYLATVQRERREGEWSNGSLPVKGGNRKGVGSRAQSTAPNSHGTRTPSNVTPHQLHTPQRAISNQQCKVQSRMKEHRATVRKLGQVQGLHSFHPGPSWLKLSTAPTQAPYSHPHSPSPDGAEKACSFVSLVAY